MAVNEIIHEMRILLTNLEKESSLSIERKEKVEHLERELKAAKEKVKHLEEKYDTYQKQNANFRVEMYPYRETKIEDGLFSDKKYLEVGYKYQLFINDVPCFQPHTQPVETIEEKELSPEKIKFVVNQIQAVMPQNAGIKLVGSLAEFSKGLIEFIPKKK